MMNKFSLKTQLFYYYIILQLVLFLIFGFILVHMLNNSIHDKTETNLKVIILDLKDDISENNKKINQMLLEKIKTEFQSDVKIRIIKNNTIVADNGIEKEVNIDNKILKDKIYFSSTNELIMCELKFTYNNDLYIIQLTTCIKSLDKVFPNLKYIFLLTVPIILSLSILFGSILIKKSFRPIENLLYEIQHINIDKISSRIESNQSNSEINSIIYEINKLLTRIELSYNNISQFSNDVSHELKTPLTIIRGEIDVILQKNRNNDDYIAVLNNILEEVINIQNTINNLLLLSKTDNLSTLDIDGIFYVDEILIGVVKELKQLSEQKNCSIILETVTPISLSGNEHLMRVVIKNILENSIFYSHNDSKIIIKLYENSGVEFLEFTDFGIGMSNENVSRIYEKFYRGDSSRSKNTGGTGLGMSLVYKICLMYNIKIDIESRYGYGTKVVLIFPPQKN